MSISKTIELVNSVYGYLTGIKDDGLAPFLVDWPKKPFKTRSTAQKRLPVLSYLPEVDTDEKSESFCIVRMLKSSADCLSWGQTYSAEDMDAVFLKKYGWVELIGLRGPVKSKDIACGFLLLGPDIEYPRHSHEAREVYLPLSAGAVWLKGNEEWILRPANIPKIDKDIEAKIRDQFDIALDIGR